MEEEIRVIKNYKKNLTKLANKYCRATGRNRSTVAGEIVGDARFFDNLGQGRGCTVATYNKVIEWFIQNMPEDKS